MFSSMGKDLSFPKVTDIIELGGLEVVMNLSGPQPRFRDSSFLLLSTTLISLLPSQLPALLTSDPEAEATDEHKLFK